MSRGWCFVWGCILGMLIAAVIDIVSEGQPQQPLVRTKVKTRIDTLLVERPVAVEATAAGYVTAVLPLATERRGTMALPAAEPRGMVAALASDGGNEMNGGNGGNGTSTLSAAELGADGPLGEPRGAVMNKHQPGRDETTAFASDSVAVRVPIERKVWQDSTYRIVGHGFAMELDSVAVYAKTQTIRETVAQTKTRRWGLGVTAGYGYGKGGFSPFVGVGLTFILF